MGRTVNWYLVVFKTLPLLNRHVIGRKPVLLINTHARLSPPHVRVIGLPALVAMLLGDRVGGPRVAASINVTSHQLPSKAVTE